MKLDKPVLDATALLTGNALPSPAMRYGPTLGSKSRNAERASTLRRANPARPEAIDDFVLGLMVQVRRHNRTPSGLFFVRREAIAQHLEVPEHFVEQALGRLRQRGLLRTAQNQPLHDTNRAPWGGSAGGWAGSTWPMNLDKLDAYIATVDTEAARRAAEASRPARQAARGPRA